MNKKKSNVKNYGPGNIFLAIVSVILAVILIVQYNNSHRNDFYEMNEFRQNRLDECYMSFNSDNANPSDLIYYLDAYDTYGEKYDKYWELEKGYLDYIDYISLRKANAAGYLVSEEKLEEFRSRIIQNANNCRNQENQVILQSYAAKVD